MKWFKLEHDIFEDYEMLELSDDEQLIWIKLLCEASKSKIRGKIQTFPEILAKKFKKHWKKFEKVLEKLENLGWIEVNKDEKYILINTFGKKHLQHGDSTERSRKSRALQRECNENATPLDKDKDKDKDKNISSTPDVDLTDKKEDDPKEPEKPEEPKNDIPYEAIGELWNQICGPVLSRIKEVTPGRRQKIKTRWNFKGRGDLVFWKDLFCAIAGTPFLLGDSNQGWKASFDWVMNNNENAAKVLEGNYVKQKRAHPECHIGSGPEPEIYTGKFVKTCPNSEKSGRICDEDCLLCKGTGQIEIDPERSQ